jgi:hypothetical protein
VIEGPQGKIIGEAGLVLIGTVLVTYVYEFALRRQHDHHLLQLVENCLVSNGPKYGLSGIKDELEFSKLFETLEKGDELLWLDTYCPDERFLGALELALKRGAKVHMLAVNPNAEVAKYRANEIEKRFGLSYDHFREEAAGQIAKLKDVLSDLPKAFRRNMELRTYDDLPCAPMYIHIRNGRPSTAFTSYFLGAPTFAEPHLKWEGSPDGFIWKFRTYFDAKWKRHANDAVELWPQDSAAVATTQSPNSEQFTEVTSPTSTSPTSTSPTSTSPTSTSPTSAGDAHA